eukprot:2082150-Heterocapsa_arctica.AAC.1
MTVEQWWEAQEKQKEEERVRDLKQACDEQDRLDMGKMQVELERHEPGQIYQELLELEKEEGRRG